MPLEGNPWFVAKEVCAVLELAPHNGSCSHHLVKLDQTEKTLISTSDMEVKGRGRTSLISESGLYKLFMRSDKPQAKAFQDWVTKEVLPSIRKTGSFVTGQPSLVENPQMSALELAEAQMNLMQAIFGVV